MEWPGRTTCDCAECVACCKRQPGPLAPGDFSRIRQHLGMTEAKIRAGGLFVKSKGALVRHLETGNEFRVGTITPARKENGECVFLTEDERCSIHEVSPAGCAYFDTHMGPDEAQVRGVWLIRLQQQQGYQELRKLLPTQREKGG